MKSFAGVESSKILLSTKPIEVREEVLKYSDGSRSTHVTALHPGAVVMLPQVSGRRLLLIRQYRHSIERELLEFPAGTLGVGEDPAFAAQRELIEEVQCRARTWIDIGIQYPTPGFCNEKQYCYLARDLEAEKGQLDDDELINVVEMSVSDVEEAIREGVMVDAKSISVFMKARMKKLL